MIKKTIMTLFVLFTLFMVFLLFLGGEFESSQVGQRAIQCKKIPQLPGAEDMVVDHAHQFIYLSIDDRRALLNGEKKQGGIHVVPMGSTSTQSRALSLVSPDLKPLTNRFHPHGIDMIEVQGEIWIWVVNHHFGLVPMEKAPPNYTYHHSIDIFKVDNPNHPTQLILQQQLVSPLLTSPNDLVILSPQEAYVTNDHARQDPWGKAFETLTKRSWGGVVHYKDKKWHTAYEGIAFANGIEVTSDHRNVLVASANGDGLYNFHRDQTGALQLHQQISMYESLDNLSWNQSQNELWVTAHPRTLRFLLHAMSSDFASPTVVFSTSFDAKKRLLSSLKVELGEKLPISGGSITVATSQYLWVGSIFESFILRCIP